MNGWHLFSRTEIADWRRCFFAAPQSLTERPWLFSGTTIANTEDHLPFSYEH
jgi:hypothetical protein